MKAKISGVGIGKTPLRKETWWFSEQEDVKWVSIKNLGNSGTYIFETSEYLTNEAIAHFKLSENSVITKEYLYLYLKNFNYKELESTSYIAKAINSK